MKKTVILILLLAGMLTLFGCGQKAVDSAGEEVLPTEGISSLTYYNGTTTLRFTKNETGWVWVDGTDFPLDDTTVKAIAEQLPALLALPSTPAGEDLSVYGLTTPSRTLTVVGDGDSTTLYFGSQTETGTWYMYVDGASDIYQVENDFVSLLDYGIYDMAVLPTMPTWTEDTIRSVSIAAGEDTLLLTYADGIWTSDGRDVSAKVSALPDALEQIVPTRCVDYTPANGVAELCGLTEPTATVTVKYINSIQAEAGFTMVIGTELENGEGYYVTLGESSAIYCVSAETIAPLLSLLDGHI